MGERRDNRDEQHGQDGRHADDGHDGHDADDRHADDGAELERLLAALEGGLREVLPGLTVLDRHVAAGGLHVADVLAVDAAGRLTLALFSGGDEERAALEALDALAFARREPDLLVPPGAAARVDTDLPPRLVLVGERFERVLAERLEPLAAAGLELWELRAVESEAGSRTRLVPLAQSPAATPRDPDAFVAELEGDARAAAERVLSGLRRIDPTLRGEWRPGGLTWRHRGRTLGALTVSAGRLRGVLPGTPPRALERVVDADPFLDSLLGRYLEAASEGEPSPLEARSVGAQRQGGARAAGPRAGALGRTAAPLRALRDEDDVELVPQAPPDRGVLLTPEELEAFRAD